MEHRSWSTFDIKSVDRAQRVIEGIASTPTPDLGGDVMVPEGAQFRLPMPFLWRHQDPVGEVFDARVTSKGIYIKARISSVAESAPASLKARLEEAWHSISAQPPLVRGLSIGWSPLEIAPPTVGSRIRKVLRWVLSEVSAVTIPMNTEATILSVKSADTHAATGTGIIRNTRIFPGVSGSPKAKTMNVSETLTTEKANLQVKNARLEELMTSELQNGGLEDGETTERNTLETEVKNLTALVNRLSVMEEAQKAQLQTIPAVTPRTIPSAMPRVEVKNLPKGTAFTRYAMAVAAGRGSMSDTLAYAKRFTNTPEVVQYLKAVEGTSVVASPGWGGELVNANTLQTEFVELLMPQTIIGRVQGFRRVPFNIPIISQTAGSTFGWVGEGGVKGVGELAFSRTTLPYHKVAGIVVLTEELVRLSTPSAEETVRRDLVDQCAKFLDEAFIQVAKAAGASNPASITNGLTFANAGGTTLAKMMSDLNDALAVLVAADVGLDGLVVVMNPEVALRMSLMVTTLGTAPAGVSLSPTGGTLLGYPVIVSGSVDADTYVIFKPSEIFLASDDRVTLDASNQATLDMAGTETPTFSLWQKNCIGLRAEQWITWAKRRTTVVTGIDTIAYVPGT